jgi:TRAP-type uncharacterized transport system substrate-binding protein
MMRAMPAPKKRVARGQPARVAVVLLAIALLAVAAARADLRPSLGHVHVHLLSGPPEGNYHALAAEVAAAAARKHGVVDNVTSDGSLDNITKLAAAAGSCEVEAALVQAGLPFPQKPELTVIARLAKAESLFLLGKQADSITEFAQLSRLRIGVGPEGSGTARVMRQIFDSRDFAALGVVLSYHPLVEQVDLAAKGELDLAAFVIDEDAALVQNAVRDRGLQIAGFPHADVVARQFRFLRKGRIGAGEYDAVRMLPPVDKEVLRVDTLVIGNGCARRSQVMGLCAALADVFPDLPRHNRETPNTTGLEVAPAAAAYWASGPELLDQYLPRVSDVMPPSNWLHLVMAVSILFNVMGVANRFLLWRIDAARVAAEHDIAHCFGEVATLGDIARLTPRGELLSDRIGAEVDRVVAELEALAQRSRKQSLSVLVPMGGEMVYRYQEALIHEALSVLRAFRERWQEARRAG